MIIILDARTAALYEAWSAVDADTAAAEAEPLVLDCARRLLAEPGGEAAHLWVAGLATMVDHLAWRPAPEARRAAVEALSAAAAALGERECGHAEHPYEQELGELDETDSGGAGVTGDHLLGESAERPRQEADLCPGNVAGVAAVTADVISPFAAQGIPEVVPREHEAEVDCLLDFLNDYPTMEPADTIEVNAYLSRRPSRGALAAYVHTQYVSCWYVIHRITARSVFDAMIEGLDEALVLLDDSPDCTHGDGEHPAPADLHYESQAALAFQLRSPGGRAEARSWLDEETPVDAWVCPRYLRTLADVALAELRSTHVVLFGVRDTSGLDAEYVRPGGGLDIGRLTREVSDGFNGGVAAQNVGLWAARRRAEDAHERLVLLHLALWTASALDLPYGPGREVRALLREFDRDAPAPDCPHGSDGHPGADLRKNWNTDDFKAHLDHLYAPDAFPAPADAYPPDAWSCPRLLAQWARESVAELDEEYAEMDEEDAEGGE